MYKPLSLDILLDVFLHGTSTCLNSPPHRLSCLREGSLKVRNKPSTRRPLMKNGKATHRGIKTEMIVSSAGDPWLLDYTEGLTSPGSLFPLLFILCWKRMEMKAGCWSHACLTSRIIACIMSESIQWVSTHFMLWLLSRRGWLARKGCFICHITVCVSGVMRSKVTEFRQKPYLLNKLLPDIQLHQIRPWW
jgi:hypothetical protein